MSRSLPWFRMYTDFLIDPKMIALAFEDQRHFIGVLALKCDGVLDQDCDGDLLDRIVAQRLWIDHAIIRDVKKRLIAAGLIDEIWQPIAWSKRQMRSDSDPTNADRQRRHREKKAQSGDRNASRNAPVTGADKIREEQTREEQNTHRAPTDIQADGLPDIFDRAWEKYPRRAGGNPKALARKAWDARVKAGTDPNLMLGGVIRYAAFCRATGKEGTEFVKQASTFFGPAGHYLEAYELPANRAGRPSINDFDDGDEPFAGMRTSL